MKATAKFNPNIEVVRDPDVLAQRSAEIFVADARKAIGAKNVFRVAVSGGHTPEDFFKLLGEMPQANSLPWDNIHLFWVDERIVDADSPWSNYKLAADTFLAKVPIPQENIHRIPTEYGDFKPAAGRYEQRSCGYSAALSIQCRSLEERARGHGRVEGLYRGEDSLGMPLATGGDRRCVSRPIGYCTAGSLH